jgi:hypothetical protein
MKETKYTKDDLILDLKKYNSQFSDDKESFNTLLQTHVVWLTYKSSSKKFKPAIVCSNIPLIKFYLKNILCYKDSEVRIKINKMNLNKKRVITKSKELSTFDFVYKDCRTLPLENVKIDKETIKMKIDDNLDEILQRLCGLSKVWKKNNHIKRIFS